jgi:hypothetical protein
VADVRRFEDAGVDRLIVIPWSRTSEALDGLGRFADGSSPSSAGSPGEVGP